MTDRDKTKRQLIEELAALRQQVAAREAVDAQHKRADEALRASESKYRRLHQSMMDAFVSSDMDGRYQDFNAAFCNMLGYDPEELRALRYPDITPEKWHAFQDEVLRSQVMQRGYSDVYEKEYRRKDGTLIPVEMRTVLVKDDDGRPVTMWGIVRDITARKRAEKSLRESEERFRKVFEEGPAGILLVDAEGRVQRCNRRFCEMLGYAEDEIIALGLAAISHPDDWQRDIPTLSRLWHGEISSYQTEKRYIRKDRQVIWGQLTVSLMHDQTGRPTNNIGMVEDITERKRAQEALQHAYDELEWRVRQRTAELAESEAKYRCLVEAAPDTVVLADLEGRITFVSQGALELYGAGALEAFLGKPAVDFVVKEDRQRLLANVQRTLQHGVTRDIEYTLIRKDGTRLAVEVSAAVIRDAAGKPMALMALVRDITERKRTEEVLRKERRTLKHLLQSSDHERQVIAYEIHDGVAQQLAGAIMQLQTFDVLRNSQPQQAANAYHAGLTMLQQGHFEVRRLIAGVRPPILDESGIVAALGHLVNEQSRLKRPQIDYHSSVDFDRLIPMLENAIYRIAQEGLENACRHSQSKKVRLRLMQREDRVRIEVRDWGIGFDVKETQGNRFGLEGIQQRARLLGGRCAIRSSPGKGTQVIVELPVVERDDDQGLNIPTSLPDTD